MCHAIKIVGNTNKITSNTISKKKKHEIIIYGKKNVIKLMKLMVNRYTYIIYY